MIKIQINKNNSWLCEAGYEKEEEIKIYDDNLKDVLDNTRWYLDNLDYLVEYRVFWGNYNKFDRKGRKRATLPFKSDNIYK
jgi:hypothetical protein